MNDFSVLIVDDSKIELVLIKSFLSQYNFQSIICCEDSREVLNLVAKENIGLIFLDLEMPYLSGEQILRELKNKYPSIPVIINTVHDEVERVIGIMKAGATDYLIKPVSKSRIHAVIQHVAEIRLLRNENTSLKDHFIRQKLDCPENFAEIITTDEKMFTLFRVIETIAKTDLEVLITGETGTGKELIARIVHKISCRKGQFVPVNVASINKELFEDTFFGHLEGAYTGARKARKGLIEQANGGTLFIDEIGDLSLDLQVKLLRFLQDKHYFPVGADELKKADVRIITATNKNLQQMVKENQFRDDLYYRLRMSPLQLPPLYKRKGDIIPLLHHFIDKACKRFNKKLPQVPKELYSILSNYPFPGNIRELEGIVMNAVAQLTSEVLSLEPFKHLLNDNPDTKSFPDFQKLVSSLEILPTLDNADIILIQEALARTNNNQTLTANLLGISRQTIYRKLNKETD